MIRQRFSLLVLVAACLLWPTTPCFAQPKPTRLDFTAKDVDGTLDNEWFGIYFQGKKIGYFNTTREKITEREKTLYREKLVMDMKIQSFDQKTNFKLEQTLDFEGVPPFRLVRADYVHEDGNIAERTKLTAKDKGYEALITLGKNETKKNVELDFTLGDTISSELWLKRKPKIGDSITTRDLEMEDLKIELSTATLADTKDSLVNGVKVVFHEVKTLSHKSQIMTESKYDDQGHMISGTIAGVFEMRRETEEEAKNTAFSSDLFILGLAKIDKAIGDTNKLTGLILEIKSDGGAILPDGPRQTLVPKGKGVYELRIGKKYGKQIKADEKDIKEGLEETNAYPISDPRVKELAKKAVGDAKTDEEKAKNISKFVHDYIKPSLAGTLPKMLDLMDRKAGDCKSYSLMFTCLARAAGLPSRQVSGFLYMGDSVKSFGGHAWNDVLLNGYWVPVDASVDQVDVDPGHIYLGTDKESSNHLLKTFGKLNFKLIEAETAK